MKWNHTYPYAASRSKAGDRNAMLVAFGSILPDADPSHVRQLKASPPAITAHDPAGSCIDFWFERNRFGGLNCDADRVILRRPGANARVRSSWLVLRYRTQEIATCEKFQIPNLTLNRGSSDGL